MFVFPHGFHVDKDGNVWASDGEGKDGKGYQVFKFSPERRVLLTLGNAGVAGDAPDTFIYPSATGKARTAALSSAAITSGQMASASSGTRRQVASGST